MGSIEAHDVSLIQRLHIHIWQCELPCLRCNVVGVVSSLLCSSVSTIRQGVKDVLPLYIYNMCVNV